MKKTLQLLLLAGVFVFGGCTVEEPAPDFSGIQHLSYSLQALTSGSTDVNVAVYPNPFVDLVRVEVFAASAEVATIYFSDEEGKYSKKITLPEGNQTRVEVRFTGLPKGIYLCEVHANGKISRYRLIKAS